jgi:pyrimidine oxygenase
LSFRDLRGADLYRSLFAARMAVSIDSISSGRWRINIISCWQRREYTQIGIWPGAEHYRGRYGAKHVNIMREPGAAGRSDYNGYFFQMDHCRGLPRPMAEIPIICASQSDAGRRYAAQYFDYYFCSGRQPNQPRVEKSVERLIEANARRGAIAARCCCRWLSRTRPTPRQW